METYAPQVISARVLPKGRTAAIVAVFGFAALTALAAQIRFPLPFTPVPITGQTFAVLLAGAALGSRLGAASQALYLAAGIVGLPVFTGTESGWETFTGATGGYLVGFVVAAAVVGALAERHHDRSILTAVPAFLTGTVIIYVLGVAWLMQVTGWDLAEALVGGVAPFVVGDLIKAAAAGALLPAAWKLTGPAD